MTRSPIFAAAAAMYREMRSDFELTLEAAHAAAEAGTHGSMLNAAGRSEPVDPYSLLTGPWYRVLKYGSPELIEWFERVGRPSVAQFEREWFDARTEPEPEADGFASTGLWRAEFPNPDVWRETRAAAQVREMSVGPVICASGAGLAPADRKLYALRDVTGTVEAIPCVEEEWR